MLFASQAVFIASATHFVLAIYTYSSTCIFTAADKVQLQLSASSWTKSVKQQEICNPAAELLQILQCFN